MAAIERIWLQGLDRLLRSEDLRAHIRPVVERVRADLARKPTALMAWEPIPLTTFKDELPVGFRSAWIFILRGGANTGAERHPNSHQRMMSFEGQGDLQTAVAVPKSERRLQKEKNGIVWQSNSLVSDLEAPLEKRWISIPPNVWHQAVVPKGADWVVVSFHTVAAEELIEERPDEHSAGGTKQKRYLSKANSSD